MVEVHSLADFLAALSDSAASEDPAVASEMVRKMKEKGFLFDVPVVFLSADGENGKQNENVLHLGETVVSFDSGTVERPGSQKTLTAKEFAILRKLAGNRGKIVTIGALCDTLWPDGSYGMQNSLIVHIRHLREKIEADPSNPRYLITVRGLGYKLANVQ